MSKASPPPGWWRPVWVCACGGQTLPIVLPMLPFLPHKVFLLHSPQSEPQTRLIRKLLKGKGVRDVSTICADAYDFGEITRKVEGAVDGINPDTIIANWTGGTKPMAVALLGALPKAVKLYFEVGRGLAVNAGSFQPPPSSANRLGLEDFAVLASVSFLPREPPSCEGASTVPVIVKMAEVSPNNLEKLQSAKRKDKSSGIIVFKSGRIFTLGELGLSSSELFDMFVNALTRDGLASVTPRGCRLNDIGAGFLSGFWWEQYVKHMIGIGLERLGLPASTRFFRSNMKLNWGGGDNKRIGNEIDAAFIMDDRLYLVTCGSGKTPAEAKVKRAEAQSIAERLGGIFSRVIVATLLNAEQLELVREDCNQDRVYVPHYSEWTRPEIILQHWGK